LRLAHFGVQRIKHALACLRPSDLSSQIQPIIQVPGHGTLPSGHATEAFITAAILDELTGGDTYIRTHLFRLAARIAINRTIAGVHFPVDSVAGAMLGLTLGKYLLARAAPKKETPTYCAWHFNGAVYPETEDFDWTLLYDVSQGVQTPPHPCSSYVRGPSEQRDETLHSKILGWLLEKAKSEWSPGGSSY
jgi:hypothetical protein